MTPRAAEASAQSRKNFMEKPSKGKEAERAFLAAYDEYADAVYRFCAMKVSDRDIARDLTQETFTRAWDYVVKGNTVDQWKAFLFRTAYNLIVDTYRKKKTVSLDQMVEDHDFAIPDADDVRSIERAEAKRMRAAIERLDETYRDIVLLRFTEDLPPREIARIMNLSENVISVRLHRGVKILRELLGPQKNI